MNGSLSQTKMEMRRLKARMEEQEEQVGSISVLPVGNIPAGIILHNILCLFYETYRTGRFIEQLYNKNRIII